MRPEAGGKGKWLGNGGFLGMARLDRIIRISI